MTGGSTTGLCRCVAVALWASVWAPAAAAQVAVAAVVQADDAVHRDIVGEIALAVSAQHRMLSPQLTMEDLLACRDEVGCIRKEARSRGASHVIVVSAAPLGTRDQVVAVRCYAVDAEKPLFEESAVLNTTTGVRPDARALGTRVAASPGLPPLPPAPEETSSVPPAADASSQERSAMGPLSWVGVAALGSSLLGLGATALAGSVALDSTRPHPDLAPPLILAGTLTSSGLLLAGVVLLVVDVP